MHSRGFLDILGIPTHVATWGRWVEEEKPDEVTIVIPGNPGLAGFYYPYMKHLFENTNIPTWIVGHAGHEEPNGTHMIGEIKGRENLFNLNGQLLHKIQFIKRYTKPTTKIHLVGHSIGGWIVEKLMKHEEVGNRIVSANLLFPTLERMAKTYNGFVLNNICRRINFLIVLIASIFIRLPLTIRTALIQIYFYFMNYSDEHIPTTIKYLCPTVIAKVLFLAYNEMDVVKDLDINNITAHKSKIKIIYNKNDGWAPGTYFLQLKHTLPDLYMKEVTYNHSFVMDKSKEVARLTAGFIYGDE